jgi:hypothetical protein
VTTMTNTLATVLQRCFTVLMPSTRPRTRETIYEKAVRIASDPTRVIESVNSDAPDWWTGRVVGYHGTYKVAAVSPEFAKLAGLGNKRLACFGCKAGVRGMLCSHAIVAEEMRLRGEDA